MNNLLSNLIIEEVSSVTTMYSDTGSGGKRIGREKWCLIFKYEGETVYKTERGEFISNSENIALLPKGSSYEWRCRSAGHYFYIDFESKLNYDGIFTFHIQNSDEIFKIFKQLEYKRLKKGELYKIESIRDVYTILLKLAAAQNSEYLPSEKISRLLPAHDFILTHYAESINNRGLAELCGMSEVYFRKLFKDAYGTSPIEYVKLVKIKKAKEMLRGDYGSVSDIATALGYPNIYDFSRDFKKRVGVSPSKYQ